MLSLLLALLSTPAASAEDPQPRQLWTLSAAGGADLPTNLAWTGVEVAAHANQSKGLAGQLAIVPAYNLSEATGLLWVEGGGTIVVPNADAPEAIVRVGLVGRVAIPMGTYRMPVRIGEVGSNGIGVVPAIQGLVESGWQPTPAVKRRPGAMNPGAAVGLRMGPSSDVNRGSCTPDSDLDRCVRWGTGFLVNFYGRVDLNNRLHFEARGGTSFSLAVGWRL